MKDQKKNKFILSVLDRVFSFLSKFRCACCNSTCIVNDVEQNNKESIESTHSSDSLEPVKMSESM